MRMATQNDLETLPSDIFRQLPSVDQVLNDPRIPGLISILGRPAVTDAIRNTLGNLRNQIVAGTMPESVVDQEIDGLFDSVKSRLEETSAFSLRTVINGTGTILHTNLGRAPLSQEAIEHIQTVCAGYSNLEFTLESGERGKRDRHVDRLFKSLLGDRLSTVVVNNNAAA